jgi:hypothetical protein
MLEYCQCEHCHGVYIDNDDFGGVWEVCCHCDKRIKGSYHNDKDYVTREDLD